MPVIDADGCPIHVQVEGPERAPVLMLSNSLGTTLAMWDGQVEPFTQHFRLVRYDRRGHGKSGRAQGALLDGAARPRRAGGARRARYQEDQLVRPLDGRHGRPVARRQCAGARRAPGADQHVELLPGQDRLERSPRSWSREKGVAGLRRAQHGALVHQGISASARRRRSRRSSDMFAATPLEGYIACGEAVRDMDHRALLPKITAPTLVIAGRHDPASHSARGERVHQPEHSRRQAHDARRRAHLQCRAAATPTPTRCWVSSPVVSVAVQKSASFLQPVRNADF